MRVAVTIRGVEGPLLQMVRETALQYLLPGAEREFTDEIGGFDLAVVVDGPLLFHDDVGEEIIPKGGAALAAPLSARMAGAGRAALEAASVQNAFSHAYIDACDIPYPYLSPALLAGAPADVAELERTLSAWMEDDLRRGFAAPYGRESYLNAHAAANPSRWHVLPAGHAWPDGFPVRDFKGGAAPAPKAFVVDAGAFLACGVDTDLYDSMLETRNGFAPAPRNVHFLYPEP